MNWDAIVADIGPRIYRYFCGAFAQERADDLTQEVLLRLVRKHNAGDFDPNSGSLLMYAFGIAKLVRLEAWRDQVPETMVNVHDLEEVLPENPTNTNAPQLRQFRRCIQDLNETQKHIVLLLIDEDLSLAEIAQMTALPLNTVKSHIHRAKEALRKMLTTEGVEYG